jgi:hypothetical protein
MTKNSGKSSSSKKSASGTSPKGSGSGSRVKLPQVSKKSSTPTDGTGPKTKE